MDIYLDIEGKPVDLDALRHAELSAHQASCPKLDEQLCLSLLQTPAERMWDVTITLQQGANQAAVLQRLPRSSTLLQPDLIRATLSGRAIQNLTRLDEVAWIARLWANDPIPLDGNLSFGFSESDELPGRLSLDLAKFEGCPASLDVSLERSEVRQLDVVIKGLWPPCRWAEASSLGGVGLGTLNGEYTLVFSYGNLRDRYRLTVADACVTTWVKAIWNAP